MATTKIEASNIATGAVPSTGFTSVQVFTAASTWTRPTDITKVIVEVVGGGGGSGSGASNWGFGGSGGSGGYAKKFVAVSSVANAVLLVGAGGIKNAGTAAGNSSWIDTAHGGSSTITGGLGGNGANGTASPGYGAGGTAGVATGGDINIPGGAGAIGQTDSASTTVPSFLSAGPSNGMMRTALSYGAALAGTAYGSGAAAGRGNNVAIDGADGADGIVIVWEYK